MNNKLVKAYIIDDSRPSIDVLRKMLEDNYSVEVIGTTTDAQEGPVSYTHLRAHET